MTLSFPPHSEQTSMSIPKTLLSLLAQFMEEDFPDFVACFSGLFVFGVIRGAVFEIWGKDSMKPYEVGFWSWNKGSQS